MVAANRHGRETEPIGDLLQDALKSIAVSLGQVRKAFGFVLLSQSCELGRQICPLSGQA